MNCKVMNQKILEITTRHWGVIRIAQIRICCQSLPYTAMGLEKNESEGIYFTLPANRLLFFAELCTVGNHLDTLNGNWRGD